MSISEAAIAGDIASGAREDLEEFNKDLIANARSEGASSFVLLNLNKSLIRLRMACGEFRESYLKYNPSASIEFSLPVLCIRRPRSEPVRIPETRACLALGKLGGGDAAELKTGRALVWEPDEKQEFGDSDTVYIGFRVNKKSK